jgi:hypothetical protein
MTKTNTKNTNEIRFPEIKIILEESGNDYWLFCDSNCAKPFINDLVNGNGWFDYMPIDTNGNCKCCNTQITIF